MVQVLTRDELAAEELVHPLLVVTSSRRLGLRRDDLGARLVELALRDGEPCARRLDSRARRLQRRGSLLNVRARCHVGDGDVDPPRVSPRGRRVKVRPRLRDARPEVAWIDLEEKIALLHILVVVDVERDDMPGDLRAQLDHAPLDERVVGGLPRRRILVIPDPRNQRREHQGAGRDEHDQPP